MDESCIVWKFVDSSGEYAVHRTLKGHSSQIRCVAISQDGEIIVTASSDTTAIIWHWESNEIIFQLYGHTAGT